MPAAGSTLKYPNRDYIFNEQFYNKLKEETKIDLSYKQVKEIVMQHLKNVAEVIEEEVDGFKLPRGLGYLCAIKYIPTKLTVDWKKTKEVGKRVYFNNLGTLGFNAAVKLFRVGRPRKNSFYDVYMFKACKNIAISVNQKFKQGKQYSDFTISDFIEKSRLENLYSKKYRKDLKN